MHTCESSEPQTTKPSRLPPTRDRITYLRHTHTTHIPQARHIRDTHTRHTRLDGERLTRLLLHACSMPAPCLLHACSMHTRSKVTNRRCMRRMRQCVQHTWVWRMGVEDAASLQAAWQHPQRSCIQRSCIQRCCIQRCCIQRSCIQRSCIQRCCIQRCCIQRSCIQRCCIQRCCIQRSCIQRCCIQRSCIQRCCIQRCSMLHAASLLACIFGCCPQMQHLCLPACGSMFGCCLAASGSACQQDGCSFCACRHAKPALSMHCRLSMPHLSLLA